MSNRAKRAILIGIDGLMLSIAERFMNEGTMPNLKKLADAGCYAEALPSIPVDTPTNWTTIVTGADPATHGIQSFTAHRAGEPLAAGEGYADRNKRSTSSRAEFIWDAGERNGLKSVVINYPTGWPATGKNQIVIGGVTPGGDLWRIRKPAVYSTGYPSTVALDLPVTQIKHDPIELREASGWTGAIESRKTPLETTIRVGTEEVGEDLFLLLTASGSDGYDRVTVAPTKDIESGLVQLSTGEWSPWIHRELNGVKTVFRLKLARLEGDEPEVELYCSDVFKAEGWCHPEGLEQEIIENAGPYVEGLECPYIPIGDENRPYGPLNVANDLTLELGKFQAEWMAGTVDYLLKKTGWDMLFMHYHLIDTLNHTYVGYLDWDFPYTTRERTAEVWDVYRKAYGIVDEMIGKIAEKCMDESTVLVITSDHSALPCWRYVSVVQALASAGLTAYQWNPEKGKFEVDLSRSKAVPYLDPQHIWVNLKGREPEGIVPPEQYEAVRDQIIAALQNIRDPENGEHPVQLVCRPEDLGIVGKAPDSVGDVLYFMKPGYSTWDGELDSLRFGALRPKRLSGAIVGPSPDVVGHHTPFLPTAKYKEFMNSAATFFSGAGIRSGYRRPCPIRLKDITPTLAYLMGIEGPEQSEGAILWDFIERGEGNKRRRDND